MVFILSRDIIFHQYFGIPSVLMIQLDLFVAGDSVLQMLGTPSQVENEETIFPFYVLVEVLYRMIRSNNPI